MIIGGGKMLFFFFSGQARMEYLQPEMTALAIWDELISK